MYNVKCDNIFNELSTIKERKLQKLEDNILVEKNNSQLWAFILKKGKFPEIQKIIEFIFSVPVSNAYVERYFSSMNNLWWDKWNRLTPENVKLELLICSNIKIECQNFFEIIISNKKLLEAARSNKKYSFKAVNKK